MEKSLIDFKNLIGKMFLTVQRCKGSLEVGQELQTIYRCKERPIQESRYMSEPADRKSKR